MSTISLIAAIDEHRGLGKNNQLLCHLPADLKHFKLHTLNKPIIMGRKTFESIGRPLPNRLNIVISDTLQNTSDITVVKSLKEALKEAGDVEEVMIIGGERLFKEALDCAKRIYVTIIHHTFDADVFFPVINPDEWHCKESTLRIKDEKNPYDMTFCLYERLELDITKYTDHRHRCRSRGAS